MNPLQPQPPLAGSALSTHLVWYPWPALCILAVSAHIHKRRLPKGTVSSLMVVLIGLLRVYVWSESGCGYFQVGLHTILQSGAEPSMRDHIAEGVAVCLRTKGMIVLPL